MRIGFICVTQETNDFNPRLTSLADYESYGILRGEEVASVQSKGSYAGFRDAVAESGLEVEMVPILHGMAVAGGRISREAYEFFEDEIRKGLAGAGKLDGLLLYLHGACGAEHLDDVEGPQAKLCREILGPDVKISFALDHHANFTREMARHVDVITGHRTQPHLPHDTAFVATKLLLRLLTEDLKPVTELRKIPLVTHQEQFFTDREPMKIWFDRARQIEAEDPKVLQVSLYPMQPWLDMEEGGWASVVCTDNDPELAAKYAEELADLVWSLRDRFLERIALPVDEAVRQADAAEQGIVILSDTGDTVFGGSSGDSNVLLESMLRQGIKGPALVQMISPELVKKLAAAGVGAEVTVEVGGEVAPQFFTPLKVTGVVKSVLEGPIPAPDWRAGTLNMGVSVIFQIGPVSLLVTELRGAAGNLPLCYQAHGLKIEDYKMAVMKTCTAFHLFDPYRVQVIRCDTPGPAQSDIKSLPWKRLTRPIYPLDPVKDWRDYAG